MQFSESRQAPIYTIRGQRIMLDKDVAALYQVHTAVLNLAVKRNNNRFPQGYVFQLTADEARAHDLPDVPVVCTAAGILMLSNVLRSDMAARMHIAVVRAFVDARKLTGHTLDRNMRSQQMLRRLGQQDVRLLPILQALDQLLDEDAAQLFE